MNEEDDKREEVEGTREYLSISYLSKKKPLSFKERLECIKRGISDFFRTHYDVIDISIPDHSNTTRTPCPLEDRVYSFLISLLIAVRGWVLRFGEAKLLPVVRIQDLAEGEKLLKEEEFIPPTPSWLYKCLNCGYIPWKKVETVIRKGKIVQYRCPSCGQEIIGEKTAATWLDEQWKTDNFASNIRSFVFQVKGAPCRKCGNWPFSFRAEIGQPLRCASCGTPQIDHLCSFCANSVDESGFFLSSDKKVILANFAPETCEIKSVKGLVTFCWDFKKKKVTEETATPAPT